MTLPAAAARAPAADIDRQPARGAGSCQSTSAARAQAATSGGCRSMGQTDGRTDTRPLHRLCTAYYAGRVNDVKREGGRQCAENCNK